MITTLPSSSGSRGSRRMARAKLVSGAVISAVSSPGWARAASTQTSAACRSETVPDGAGRTAWPMPWGPWVSGVVTSGMDSGTSAPTATSTPVRPHSSSMARVFRATWCASTFPGDAVTATNSTSGNDDR